MKKINLLIMAFILSFLAASCIKQKNCKDCISGKWIYLKEPMTIVSSCDNPAVAMFYPDAGQGRPMMEMPFTGKVPKKFQSLDTIRVAVSFKSTCRKDIVLGFETYKLKCIEKEN